MDSCVGSIPGWPLVTSRVVADALSIVRSGTGLAPLSQMHKPMDQVISSDVTRYNDSVATFSPESNSLKTASGEEHT